MVSTRSHTPIPQVVAAAGVQQAGVHPYRVGSGETSRSATQEDEDTWVKPRQQSKNLGRNNAKREKRRATSEERWRRPIDDSLQVEVEPSESDNASLYDNWGLTSTMKKFSAETDHEDERTYPPFGVLEHGLQKDEQSSPRNSKTPPVFSIGQGWDSRRHSCIMRPLSTDYCPQDPHSALIVSYNFYIRWLFLRWETDPARN